MATPATKLWASQAQNISIYAALRLRALGDGRSAKKITSADFPRSAAKAAAAAVGSQVV
jgi:hypothetical protein